MRKWNLQPAEDDGLPKSKAKAHSAQKHYYLQRYIDAFTTAMRPKVWKSLHYVDLFSGAGVEELETGMLCWGSPLIAAQSPTPFDQLHLCELDRQLFEALKERIKRLGLTRKTQLLLGDANDVVLKVVEQLPAKSLSFAFLDPCGLHLHYSTVKALSKARCDLLIFFPDHVDLLRNWQLNYWENPESNPDKVFGPNADWRSILEAKPRTSRIRELTRLYEDQLRTLGYRHFGSVRIRARNRPIYQLIFCSRHPAGEKIWRGIVTIDADKQRRFDW